MPGQFRLLPHGVEEAHFKRVRDGYSRPVVLNIDKCLLLRFPLHRGRFHGSHTADVSAFLSTGCHRLELCGVAA
jgi:hypothetical protein